MNEACIANLKDIKQVLENTNADVFSLKLNVLSGSSIGQHVRHVLEFYLCLLNGVQSGVVNYDLRERNLELESELETALDTIDCIIAKLHHMVDQENLVLQGDSGVLDSMPFSIETNLQRELVYNLEHSIHHQAIIKIGLNDLCHGSILSKEFGIAPSTLRSH